MRDILSARAKLPSVGEMFDRVDRLAMLRKDRGVVDQETDSRAPKGPGDKGKSSREHRVKRRVRKR